MKLKELIDQLRDVYKNCGDMDVKLHSTSDYSPTGQLMDYYIEKIQVSGDPKPTQLVLYPFVPPFRPLS